MNDSQQEGPPRPAPEALEETYRAKRKWHRRQAALPIEDKVRILLALQKVHCEMGLLRGDKLEWWQKPWPSDS